MRSFGCLLWSLLGERALDSALATRFLWRSSLSWYRLECMFIASKTVASLRSLCRVVFLTNHSQLVIIQAILFWAGFIVKMLLELLKGRRAKQ